MFLNDEINLNYNLIARKELKEGNNYFHFKQFQEAEISWNNSIKIATSYNCYDTGTLFYILKLFRGYFKIILIN